MKHFGEGLAFVLCLIAYAGMFLLGYWRGRWVEKRLHEAASVFSAQKYAVLADELKRKEEECRAANVPPVADPGAWPFLTGYTTSAATETTASPSGWWYGLAVFPKAKTSGASVPEIPATPKVVTPKRKRARGSSTAGGRRKRKA